MNTVIESRNTEKRSQYNDSTTKLHKTTKSSSSNDLSSYCDTNHNKPKRNREKSPPNIPLKTKPEVSSINRSGRNTLTYEPQASSSYRTGRKNSTHEFSSTSRPKVKERSSSLSVAGRSNIGNAERRRNGDMNGETNREALRQLLCDLRKDAMDDDLENNDGTFFPCEFCGDPYPVEYLMRHQVRKKFRS